MYRKLPSNTTLCSVCRNTAMSACAGCAVPLCSTHINVPCAECLTADMAKARKIDTAAIVTLLAGTASLVTLGFAGVMGALALAPVFAVASSVAFGIAKKRAVSTPELPKTELLVLAACNACESAQTSCTRCGALRCYEHLAAGECVNRDGCRVATRRPRPVKVARARGVGNIYSTVKNV